MPLRGVRIGLVASLALTLRVAGIAAQQVPPATAPGAATADSQAARAPHGADSISSVSPLTLGQKAALYSARTFSLRTILGASYAAGVAQWRGTPREWGAGLSGYARRDAAVYGGLMIRHTAEFGIGALLHEDPRFERSSRNGFTRRAIDALHNTALVRTDDGSHHIAWSRAAAAIATGFAVNSWEPRRMHSAHHALMLSLGGVVGYATSNLTREFAPDVKQYVKRELHGGGGS